MKIIIKYSAEILSIKGTDNLLDSEVEETIEKTHDNESNLHQWLDDSLEELGIIDTLVNLEFDKEKREVYSKITYRTVREPNKEELTKLKDETTNQLTDGYGEEPWILKSKNKIIEISLMSLLGENNPISVERIKESNDKKLRRNSDIFTLTRKGKVEETEKYLTKEVLRFKNKWGLTPLEVAIGENHTALALTMIDKNADVNHGSPLSLAVQLKNLTVIKKLLKEGANVNYNKLDSELNRSETPLMWAVNAGSLKIIELLLKYGADINLQNVDGQTALFYVKEVKITEFLLQNKANLQIKDNRGETVIENTKAQLKFEKFEELKYQNTKKIESYKGIIRLLEENKKSTL